MIADYTAHALPLGHPHPRWRSEYSFGSAYGLPAFDAPSLRRLPPAELFLMSASRA